MKHTLLLTLGVVFLITCQPPYPESFTNPSEDPDHLSAAATDTAASPVIARKEAEMRARVSLFSKIELCLPSWLRTIAGIIPIGPPVSPQKDEDCKWRLSVDGPINRRLSDCALRLLEPINEPEKNAFSMRVLEQILSRTQVVKESIRREGRRYQAYVVIEVPIEKIRETFLYRLSKWCGKRPDLSHPVE